jgi:hypothetical protein
LGTDPVPEAVFVLVLEDGLDEVETALRRRIDRRVVDRVQRALRKRREGADRLDLVAEQLDPQRIAPGRREDVDEPPANGELPALLDPLHPLVAGEREPLRQAVDATLVARGEVDPTWSCVDGRQALRERHGRGADEAPGREDVEGSRALADQVRRRLEPRLPGDTAAREQRDALLAQVPRRRLSGVARVGVLRQEHDERTREAEVEGGEDERQRRLGHAGSAAFEVGGERAESLALGELAREGVQRRPVHDERRNRAVPLRRVY